MSAIPHAPFIKTAVPRRSSQEKTRITQTVHRFAALRNTFVKNVRSVKFHNLSTKTPVPANFSKVEKKKIVNAATFVSNV